MNELLKLLFKCISIMLRIHSNASVSMFKGNGDRQNIESRRMIHTYHFVLPELPLLFQHNSHLQFEPTLFCSSFLFLLYNGCCEATHTNVIVWGFARSGHQPTINHTRIKHTNHYTTDARGNHTSHYTTDARINHTSHYTTDAVYFNWYLIKIQEYTNYMKIHNI